RPVYIAGVAVGIEVLAAGRRDELHDGAPYRKRVDVRSRGPEFETLSQIPVFVQEPAQFGQQLLLREGLPPRLERLLLGACGLDLPRKLLAHFKYGQADRDAVLAEEAVLAVRACAASTEPLISDDQADGVLAVAIDARGDFPIGDLQILHRVEVFEASLEGPGSCGEPDVGFGKRQRYRHADH